MKFSYPKARRDDSVIDEYHGTKVPDPYKWLEDPDCEETKGFVDQQNDISRPLLDQCPVKEKLKNRITEMWDYPKYSCPYKRGDHYYYYFNTGLQNQSVLYVQDTLESEPRVFLDPNKLSEDGTISLRNTAFTENGEYFAYGLSKSGSDWVTIQFKKAPSGEDLPDILENVKFTSLAWTHDNKGLFYNQYLKQEGKSDGTETTSNVNQKLFYHRLGDDQSKDVLVAEFPDNPKWMMGAEVSDCGDYLVLAISEGCDPVNRLYYTNLKTLPDGIAGLLPFVKVVDNFDAEYEYITNEGTVFTFKTNLKSPRYKLINIDLADYEMEKWTTLVPEDEKSVLQWASCVNTNKLILCYLEDVKNRLYIHDLATGQRNATLPLDVGTVAGYSGKKKQHEIFYQFVSFLTPGVIYHCDISTNTYTPKVFREIKIKNFDLSQFETKQVFYPSKDGTKIPMFIVLKKGVKLDGNNPVMLYGYGGFNIAITPSFSVSRLVYLQHLGGVYAVANIRGGGEYGETWHKGGMLANKQNVFNDFQAAAEYLIKSNYTCAKRITINGGSNGGLLVAACANQRPDLFGCVINQVGVMDMLKFHMFTIGHAWTTDFGCADKPEEFNYLIKYSPLHNIKVPEGASQYPATLLLTGDHDDRVVPLHSLKYIAELQHVMSGCEKQTNPLVIRVDTKSGHGAGKPTAKVIEELTDVYCFIYQYIGLQWTD
ncbi:prolyl endopeptidase-like [Mytilus californianus]|uniref:prolyl endopeptidase-like n=1 Tax=Mytilus californianus TaxID=6549 RepID=UPI00224548E6|nr:prolyl endopeptidase-like [Mytilus californianus]